ncbi:MAG TPA: CocE/NonD family hydrolase [Candidatus Kryptonia bacterium]|nr:CocE/NonD family hydrolase [Candidatus Kryptonia bacterium]
MSLRTCVITALACLALLPACGGEVAAPASGGTHLDLSHASPAAFVAHSSVEQLFVTDAQPGTDLELVAADGTVLQDASADDQGTLIFRNVPVASGYRVASHSGTDLLASAPVRAMARDDVPPSSFYEEQHLQPGYGYIQTRDGTTLAVNAILPGNRADGSYPTVIEYSGYDPANPDSPQPSSLIASTLGYAVVGINMRGSGCSGGAFNFFETVQSTDGYDAVEIVAAQPWVKNHKVGMVGISYPGISQLFVAQLQPPHLAAIAPLSVISDTYNGTLYPGGILNNGFAVQFALDRQHDAMPYGQPWSLKRMEEGDQVCIDNQKLRGQSPDLLATIQANKYYVPSTADPLAPVTFVDRINVPVFLAGAWQDEQTGPYFATMLDHFTGTSKAHFTMTNGGHTDSLDPVIYGRWVEFLSLYVAQQIPHVTAQEQIVASTVGQQVFGVADLHVDVDRFAGVSSFDAALATFEADPKIRILFDNGAGDAPGVPAAAFEATFDRWPIPAVEPGIWYFAANGRLDEHQPTGAGADAFTYDPSISQQTTFNGSNSNDVWLALPAWDWRPDDAGKAVAYVTDPLPATMVMAGSGSVDLWLKSTANDTDVQVTLSEIRPDGQETYVQNGWLRASHRKLDPQRSTVLRPVHTNLESDAADLPPNQFASVRVELFPFAHVFHAGSRIRIAVESPGGSRPLWKFDVLPADTEVRNTIGRSAAAPSRLVLPLVPGIDVPTSLPPCPSLRGQPCRPYVEIANEAAE